MSDTQEKYQGTGKVASVMGQSAIWTTVLSVAGAVIGGLAAVWKKGGALGLVAFTALGGLLGGLFGGVYGTAKGYRDAKHGEKQFHQARAQVEQLSAENQALHQQVGQLQSEKSAMLQGIIDKGAGATSPERVAETIGAGAERSA